jgi:hypothetical protein
MSQNYNIIITGGTSPGPYTIYYNQIVSTNIAIEYQSTNLMSGLSLAQLTSGVLVTVPDNTTVIYVYNSYCDTYQQIPVSDSIPTYDFCLTILGDIQIHFNPNGEVGGYQSWISDDSDYQITWDTSLNLWKVSGGYLPYATVSSSSYPPLSGWYLLGSSGTVIAQEGLCVSPTQKPANTVSINQPTCGCNGSIVITPSGGVGPYQGSINNGVTYGGLIYNNLCSGNYSVLVKDSNDDISLSQNVTLNSAPSPTVYTISISSTVSTTSSSPTSTTKTFVSTVNVSPSLPLGSSIEFDLNHFSVFNSSPLSNTGNMVNNSVLTINGTPTTVSITSNNNSTSNSTIPGCQANTVYTTGLTEIWQSITINPTDIIVLTTSVTVASSSISPCKIANSVESFQVSNARLYNCSAGLSGTSGSCCELVVAPLITPQ